MNHSASTIISSERNLVQQENTTTIVLIVGLHLLFLHQWNSRRRRKDLLVSYSVIVQKRQFHKLWLALLSHPPTRNSNRHSSTPTHAASTTTTTGEGTATTTNNSDQFNGNISPLPPQLELRGRLTAVIRHLASWSYQSGFALLLYNSHILWSCRALEGLYDYGSLENDNNNENNTDTNTNKDEMQYYYRPLQYARVLLALTTMALLVELRFSYMLLRISKRLMGTLNHNENNEDSSAEMTIPLHHHDTLASSNSTDTMNRMQQKILRRPIGTLTALTCALIVVFQNHFNYISLQVLPFVDNRVLFLGFSAPIALTSLLCWAILAYLSYPSHPITPLMSGLLSGGLWALGLTSFLQDAYWGSCLLVMVMILCCLSLRASDNHTREAMERASVGGRSNNNNSSSSSLTWIPCVDYVSWNYRGQRVRGAFDDWDPPPPPRNTNRDHSTSSSGGGGAVPLSSTTIDFLSSSDEEDDDDDDDGTSSDASIYSSHQPARFSDMDDSTSGRDDNNHFEDVPLLPEHHGDRTSQTMRARRGLGTTSSSHG